MSESASTPVASTPRPIRKYFLFAGGNYYPRGGFLDLVGAYASRASCMEALVAHMAKEGVDWAHITCGTEIVWSLPAR